MLTQVGGEAYNLQGQTQKPCDVGSIHMEHLLPISNTWLQTCARGEKAAR
jgi:hypothetical protein